MALAMRDAVGLKWRLALYELQLATVSIVVPRAAAGRFPASH
jgi:hypothetical protein